MVDLSIIRQSNSALQAGPAGLVCLFVGATRGIGASTLKELVKDLDRPKVYVVGRSKSKFSIEFAELKALNPNADIIFIESEISHLKNVDAVCEEISSQESSLDLLFMSAGMLAFGGPYYTSEGIEQCASLSYYSRMRFTINLLPLMKKSKSPRILSVLAGGNERKILTHDLGLEQNYSIINMVNHTTTMHTLAFEHIAESNPSICFIHAYPGWVQTDILDNFFTYNPHTWYSFVFSFARIVAALGMRLFAISPEEAGERQAFHATSWRYLSKSQLQAYSPAFQIAEGRPADCSVGGNGVYRLGWKGEGKSDTEVLGPYREEGLPAKIWDHTLSVFEKALTSEKCVDKEN